MLKKKKKSECEYEIDRELTGKFAIEKNAEYQERIAELEEENKKLKERIERLEKCFKKGGFNPQDVECLMEEDTLQELRDLGKI